jgi:hypothetical protein
MVRGDRPPWKVERLEEDDEMAETVWIFGKDS